MNIALIGMMGTFKTSAGKLLAQKLNYNFVDTDDMLTAKYTKKIFGLLPQRESDFRKCEHMVVIDAASLTKTIIACGGGVATVDSNVDRLKKTCTIVLLTADLQAILQRVQKSDDRPLLSGENKLEKITKLMEARQAKYLAAADIIVDNTYLTSQETAQEILQALSNYLVLKS